MEARKLTLSAGAEWLLGAFALLRRSPFGYGVLGLVLGLIMAVPGLFAGSNLSLSLALQLGLAVIVPILMGGLVWAAHKVDHGRPVSVPDLFQGFANPRAPRLLATLLPQVLAGVVAAALLMLMLGTGQLSLLQEAMQTVQQQAQSNPQAPVDPSVFDGVAMGRLALWFLLVMAISILAGFATFTAHGAIMLADRPALEAMKASLRGCLRNIGAMLVFFVLLVIAMFGISLLVQIIALLVRLAAGDAAMMFVMNLLLMTLLMPLLAGSMYMAWKQMFGDGADASQPLPVAPANGGFEA